MGISDEEKALFRQEVGRVKPVKNDKVEHPRRKVSIRVRKALQEETLFQDMMSDETHWLNPDNRDEHRFIREGVSFRVMRDLVQGRISPDASIDLHGLTASEARDELSNFLYLALKQNLYCINIIHGQGYSSEGKPIIRGLVERWLRLNSDVLAFSNPPQRMGGRGATLAVLRAQNPFERRKKAPKKSFKELFEDFR